MKQLTASQAIKKDLKKAFPEIKFSVRGDYNSVSIWYENGPAESVLNSLVCKYECGHFDSSTDCYEYTNNRKDIPQVKFVMCQRTISDTYRQSILDELNKKYGSELTLGNYFRTMVCGETGDRLVYRFMEDNNL
jgi:hypothetical protein